MPELELRSAWPEESDATVRLLSAAGLPVEDLEAAMLDAFVVAGPGRKQWRMREEMS